MKTLSFLLLILILATGLSGDLLASEDDESEKEKSENAETGQEDYYILPVTVRAVRESRDLKNDRAAAGSVLLPEDFDDAGDTMNEVLDQQAGLRVTKLGGPASFSTLSIRGSTSEQVAVVLDGVRLNSAAGGPVDLSRLPLGNVERIEIYRGTAPVSLGGSAIGGLLSVTTRSARERQLSLSVGGGSFGERETRAYWAEPHDSWDLALGLDYSGWEGSFPYINDNGTRFIEEDDRSVIRRNNDFDQVNLLGKARLHFDDKWSMTLTDWLFWREQGVAGLGQFETNDSRYESLENLALISVKGRDLGQMADWYAQASFRYGESAFDDPSDEIGLSADGSRDRSYTPSVDTGFKLQAFSWWDISGRAGYRYDSFQPSSSVQTVSRSERHTLEAGLESGWLIEAIDLLILPSGSVEWQDSRLDAVRTVSGATTIGEDSSKTEWSWRAALVNQSIPDTKLTLSGGRSVRFPSLFELFGNSGRVLGNSSLLAESAYNVDGGIVYDSNMLPEPYRLRLELYAFYSQVQNLIQFVQTAQNVSKAENIDQARFWGIEAGLRSDLFSHLRVFGNYSFLDAINTGDIAARRDKNLPFRPASKWYLRAEIYATEIPTLRELSFFADAEWIAGNFLDNANIVSVSDRFYLNAGFSIELESSVAKLSFSASNLTDERTADLAGYPLPGRSFTSTLTVNVL